MLHSDFGQDYLTVRAAIEDLLLIWTASESEEWKNLIVELPLRVAIVLPDGYGDHPGQRLTRAKTSESGSSRPQNHHERTPV